jgi:hypothetical protein
MSDDRVLRRGVAVLVAAGALAAVAAVPAAEAKSKPSCAAIAKARHLKTQLSAGGYVAYGPNRHQLTICDTKKRTAFDLTFFDDGQSADKMLAVSGRCIVLTTKTPGGLPALAYIRLPKDLRSNGTASFASASLGYGHTSATVESVVLSKSCIVAAGVQADDTLQVETTNITAGTHQTFPAGPGTTAAELRKLKINGSTVTWTEAGQPRSEQVT